jgi:hypothetical protein
MSLSLTTGRILKRDWPAFTLLLFLGFWWLAMIAIVALTASATGWQSLGSDKLLLVLFGFFSALITVVCGGIVWWRVRTVRRVFAAGVVVEGEVGYVGENSEDIGYAVVLYRYNGRDYRVQNATEGAPGRGGLAVGDTVELVVDPLKPARAFVLKLYQ